jgi:hypothetical protein
VFDSTDYDPALIIEGDKYGVVTQPINVIVVDKNGIIANNFSIAENFTKYPYSYFEITFNLTPYWSVPEASITPYGLYTTPTIKIPIVNGVGTIPPFTIGLSSQYKEISSRKNLCSNLPTFYVGYNASPAGSLAGQLGFNTFGIPVIVKCIEARPCILGFVTDGKLTYAPVSNGGAGYESVPEIRIVGGGGSGAQATAEVYNGVIARINITNQGSGYTSRPVIMAADSICPECPPIPFPTCLPGLNCLQTNYNYSGICPASYTCIPCPTTTTTTTTTNAPIAVTSCDAPATSFTIGFVSGVSNSMDITTDTLSYPLELNTDGYAPLERIKFLFYHTENDMATIWPGINCPAKRIYVDILSIKITSSNPDFIITLNGDRGRQILGGPASSAGITTIDYGWFETQTLCINWIGSDPSIFSSGKEIEIILTFEFRLLDFRGFVTTLTQYA